MTILLFANQAQTTLAAPISAVATQIQVAVGTANIFPSPAVNQAVTITLVSATNSLITEIVSCTNITGDVLTIVRGQQGTTARAWATNDFVVNLMTAGDAAAFAQIWGLENAVYSASLTNLVTPTATIGDAQLTTGQITTAPVNANDITNKSYVDAQIGNAYDAGTGLNLIGNTFSIADTPVVADQYGAAAFVPQINVNNQGQLTSAVDVAIQIIPSQVTGLGTMATQNANAVAITGGTATGVDITGGFINNTPIGTITPAQGEFTNLVAQDVQFTTGRITFTPVNPTDIVNKGYVDTVASSNVNITGGFINGTTIGNTVPEPITATVYNNMVGGTF